MYSFSIEKSGKNIKISELTLKIAEFWNIQVPENEELFPLVKGSYIFKDFYSEVEDCFKKHDIKYFDSLNYPELFIHFLNRGNYELVNSLLRETKDGKIPLEFKRSRKEIYNETKFYLKLLIYLDRNNYTFNKK